MCQKGGWRPLMGRSASSLHRSDAAAIWSRADMPAPRRSAAGTIVAQQGQAARQKSSWHQRNSGTELTWQPRSSYLTVLSAACAVPASPSQLPWSCGRSQRHKRRYDRGRIGTHYLRNFAPGFLASCFDPSRKKPSRVVRTSSFVAIADFTSAISDFISRISEFISPMSPATAAKPRSIVEKIVSSVVSFGASSCPNTRTELGG
jgi:hypothetical protein